MAKMAKFRVIAHVWFVEEENNGFNSAPDRMVFLKKTVLETDSANVAHNMVKEMTFTDGTPNHNHHFFHDKGVTQVPGRPDWIRRVSTPPQGARKKGEVYVVRASKKVVTSWKPVTL